jgi:hypothetical protein
LEIIFDVAFLDISLEENSNKISVSENTKKGLKYAYKLIIGPIFLTAFKDLSGPGRYRGACICIQ